MPSIPALPVLLYNLKQLIADNTHLIGEALNNDLNGLCRDLDELIAFVKDYPGRQNENEFIRAMENNIRDVVFEAEYVIETYIVHASKQKHRGLLAKAIHKTEYEYGLRSLGEQIAEVRAHLEKISQKDLPRIGLEASKTDEISSRGPSKKQVLLFEEDNVVGFEDSAHSIIKLLRGRGKSQQHSDQLEVISIVGMAGLGKTTLARKVFNIPEIEYRFYARAFVHISQEYERKEVFLKILSSVTEIDEELYKMSDDQLAHVLREHLQTKSYLIVMDDVWTIEAWEDLKPAFPNNYKGSRVLITSRNAAVAHHANPKIEPYILRFLTPEESRKLLRIKVFGEDICPEELQIYETKILEKCDGLPLAIVVVAGILLNNRASKDWWMKVAANVNDEQSYDVIRRSYNNLPYYLKPCFLYLGVFPGYFEIPAWKLLRLWIAEGFIQHQGLVNMEDVAEGYLMELVDRSLVMIGQKRSDGRIKTCRMHDMLREFCQAEAMKENLFREIKWFVEATLSSNSSSHKDRRLCVNSHIPDYVKAKPTGEYVGSFLSFAREEIHLPLENISSILKAFKLLKVLDIRSILFTRLPAEFVYLVLLKYIAISCNWNAFPAKMSALQNLQTIIIETSSRTLDIKAEIWKMAQLRHLHTNCSTSIPKGKEESLINANLQTLSTISPESCRREVFERTPKLRKLGICGKLGTNIEEIFDSLVKLNFLENLKLLNDDATSKLPSLPPENKFPRKLTRLTLQNTSLDWKYMSILGKLETLEILKLKDNAFLGQFWETEDGGFRCLKVLHIGRTNLVVWKASASNFPTLRSLFLRHCDRLEAIPSGLGEISSFLVIDLYYTNPSVVTSARGIQLLKLRLQAQQEGPKRTAFKLSVYPPEQ